MSDPTEASGGQDGIVRARRFEATDRAGRPRVVMGEIGTPDPDALVFGIAVLDEVGRERVRLVLDGTGPNLLFDLAGNNIITLGVNDPAADALHVGGYLCAADLDGTPVLGWHIEEDGTAFIRTGGPTR